MIPAPVIQFFRGMCMGAADIVPGVSGGTVALIFGIYKSLIANVRSGATVIKLAITGDVKAAWQQFTKIDWLFIAPLGAGVLLAFALLRHPMESALINQAPWVASVFLGLVLASCVLVWKQMSDHSGRSLAIIVTVSLLVFVLLAFQAGAIADPPIWAFPLAGSISICAMILPGISGSFILLMMGMYAAVLEASIADLAAFGVGAIIGLALFSSALNWLLETHEQTVLAVLLGIMLGSFRVLWPWPNGVGFTTEADIEVSGTGLEWPPNVADMVKGLILMAIAFAATMAIVRFAKAEEPQAA